jgi:iron complex outermembrane recepter protein
MIARTVSFLLAGSCLAAVTQPAFAAQESQAAAQPAGETQLPAGGVEDIVVTARKVSENLQDVPAAITALTAEKLDDLQINNFVEIGRTAPNVHVQKQAGSPTAPQFNIRGITAGSINFQIDSGIALYVDGVYLGRPGNAGFDLADLERLEIARGPQGTLFGRNSTGGAINFITSAPTGKLGIIAEGTVGNFDRRRGRVTLNTPEWNGLSARITYVHDENEGSVRNSAPVRRTFLYPEPFGRLKAAKTFGANNIDSVLAAVRFRGIDDLTVDYKFDYADLVTTLDAMQLIHPGPLFTDGTNLANQPALGGTAVFGFKRRSRLPLDAIAPSTQESWGHSLTAVGDLSDTLTVKYIGAVRGFTVNTQSELDGNMLVDPLGSGRALQRTAAVRWARQRQWSHELQLLGRTNHMDWVVGLFNFRERARLDSPVQSRQLSTPGVLIPITNPGSYLAGGALQRVLNKSWAGYAHGTVRAGGGVELGGGIRYSLNDRTEDDRLDAPRTPPRGKHRAQQNHFDYDASVKYQFAEHGNVYAKYATGFVSGGVFNSVEFQPETAKSIELGVKTDLLDRRLRVNLAAFHAKRKNRQVAGFIEGAGNILTNIGGDRARGIELETTLVPVDALTLTANYGFADVKTTSGVRSQQPRHTGYLAAEYEFPELGNGIRPRFRVDGQYEGRQWRLVCPAGSTSSEAFGCSNLQNADFALDRKLRLPANWDVGARLTLADIPLGGVRGNVSVWGKNLLNNDDFEYIFQISGRFIGTFQTPRTYGLDFKVQF